MARILHTLAISLLMTCGSTVDAAEGNIRSFFKFNQVKSNQMEIEKEIVLAVGGTHPVDAMAFNYSGKILATKQRRQITVWDVSAAKVIARLNLLPGASTETEGKHMSFSPDGKILTVCHSQSQGDVVVRVWRTSDWTVVTDVTESGRGVVCSAGEFSKDGQIYYRLAARGPLMEGENIIAYETRNWTRLWGKRFPAFYPSNISIASSGKQLAVIGTLRNVKVWEEKSSRPVFGNPPELDGGMMIFLDPLSGETLKTTRILGDDLSMSGIAWSADGENIAISTRSELSVRDARNGNLVTEHKRAGRMGAWIEFSADGSYLLDIGKDKNFSVEIWNGNVQQRLVEIPGRYESLATHSSTKRLALSSGTEVEVFKIRLKENK